MSEATTPMSYDVIAGWERLPGGLQRGDVTGIGVDSRDRVLSLTRQDARVMVFDREGAFQLAWGEDILSQRPHGLTVAPDDTVYVVDEGRHAIRHFTAEGELLRTIGTPDVASDTGYDGKTLASIERGGGPFNRPTNIAVAPSGDLYVSDGYGNARVHRFDADGELVQSWGEPGDGPGELHVSHGVAVTADGRVVVADRENERLQFFTADGEFLEQWTDVQRPTNIAIDAAGRLHVAELSYRAGERSLRRGELPNDLPGRMSVFDDDGALLARWGGTEPCTPGSFVAPHDVAVDSRGDVYVAELAWTAFEVVQRRPVPEGCPALQKFTRVG